MSVLETQSSHSPIMAIGTSVKGRLTGLSLDLLNANPILDLSTDFQVVPRMAALGFGHRNGIEWNQLKADFMTLNNLGILDQILSRIGFISYNFQKESTLVINAFGLKLCKKKNIILRQF